MEFIGVCIFMHLPKSFDQGQMNCNQAGIRDFAADNEMISGNGPP